MSEQAVFDALKYRIVVDEHGCSRYYNAANQLHRLDGPAIEYVGGHKEWWQNDELHRTDGAAIEYPDGTKRWYQNGKTHRTDGPAIKWANGSKAWYQNGQRMTEEEFNQAVKSL